MLQDNATYFKRIYFYIDTHTSRAVIEYIMVGAYRGEREGKWRSEMGWGGE